MKKLFVSLFFSIVLGVIFFVATPKMARAYDAESCNLCLNGTNPKGDRSQCTSSCSMTDTAPSDVFGTVQAPPGVAAFNNSAGAGGSHIGIIVFISNIIKLATVIAGIYVLFNFISAGFTYITSMGETKAATQVKDQITSSVLGLILIIGAYTMIGVISYFIFGDAGYILNPTIQGPK